MEGEEAAGGCAEMEVEVAGVEEVDFVLFDEEEGVIHIALSSYNGRGAWSREGDRSIVWGQSRYLEAKE